MNSRKLSAITLFVAGIILLNSAELKVRNSSDLVMIGISLLPIIGLILVVLGAYRFFAKGKTQ